MNTPTAYSGIRAWVLPPNATTSDAAMSPSSDDAHRERQAVTAEGELAGEEPVLGEDGGEPRERVEARVRGQEQEQRREALEEVEADRTATEHDRAIWAMTVCSRARRSAGSPKLVARNVIPTNSVPRMTAMTISVAAAFLPRAA